MKKSKKITIAIASIVLAVAIAFGTYFAIYAFWGRRHSVLYDVNKVVVTNAKDDVEGFNLKLYCTAKTWPLQSGTKAYKYFGSFCGGEANNAICSGQTDDFVVISHSKTEFTIDLVANSGDENMVQSTLNALRLSVEDEDGNNVGSATLYMTEYMNTVDIDIQS